MITKILASESLTRDRESIIASNLFRENNGDFHLIGTMFIFEHVFVEHGHMIFYSRGWKYYLKGSVHTVSFEHVFNNVTNQHREKLAFMLDILDC